MLFVYAARYQDVLAGEFGALVSGAVTASIDQDFVGVSKGVGDVAATTKTPFPSGPPMLGQSVSEKIAAAGVSEHSRSH